MTIKHTPEPWYLPPGDLIFVSKVGGKGYVAKMMPLDAPRDRKGLPTDISDEMCANARRIVACVNALRGVPTEELERHHLAHAGEVRFRIEMTRQRDELLAKLSEIYDCFEGALIEGWLDALADEDISRIKDIYCRRIDYARGIAVAALAGGAA
ncbi:hypothetical protein RRM56_000697 [Aeromonas salmonicida subsp. salmonicida]|uniref:hypothetical protein n=1 Tax=Aeromonas salmonicida TaxID=645 RepID=UPI0005443FC7|nr:hypothetical protein [Aeromonas salmonicida]ELI6443089.1 hypothetical protein [Aeromonas salmonicida subsp. salmonicida]ELY1969257.1 hypothetical protein [Aeromonas salmonicida]ELY2000707.1 hypothetical protein [Aeromonas salmonicida]KHE97377.1 hypothetical protein NX85_17640 [Aeromonas salmonicida subsp. salmonicida]KHE98658.1 hypothetical protein NV17_08235 [Aeromonas salmonicida subsp. salmonicida]